MDPGAFAQVASTFSAFHQRFAPLFGRPEAQQRSEQYLRGLLVQQTDRRNAENLAEAVTGATPRALQRFVSESPWRIGPVIDALQTELGERLNTPDGVFVLDETGFPKQGRHSVGVARQYCGTLGKVGNCQLGVFLAYVSERGHALVDHRLYLPRVWTDDAPRRQAAGVPPEVTYQSKAELGLAMLDQSQTRGSLSGDWVTADEDYGKVPSLRDALTTAGWRYVLEVPWSTPVFERLATSAVPAWSGHGRRPTRVRLAAGEAPSRSAQAIAAEISPVKWQVLLVGAGAQGPRQYQFAAQRIWEAHDGLPGPAGWLVLRRNLDGSEPKAYLSNAPADTPLLTMARVGAQRWPIETEFQTEKGETGLDEYEVRGWSGWQHHITLSLLAGAFLLAIQQEWGEKHATRDPAPGEPGAARVAPPASVDRPRPAGVVDRYPTAQRPRHAFACQTTVTRA